MKKLSYLLILFISLFMITGIVKAYDNGGSLNLDPALYIDGENDTLYKTEVNTWLRGQFLGIDEVQKFTNGSYDKICYYSISGSMGEVDLIQVVKGSKSIIIDLGSFAPVQNYTKILDINYCPNGFATGYDNSNFVVKTGNSYDDLGVNSFRDVYYQVYTPARYKKLETGCSYKDSKTGNEFVLYFDAEGYLVGTYHNTSKSKTGTARTDGHVAKTPESISTNTYENEIIHESFYFYHATPGKCPDDNVVNFCYDKKNKRTYITASRNVTDDCVSVSYIDSTEPIEEPIENVERTQGCSRLNDSLSCITDKDYSCVWVDKKTGKIDRDAKNGYCNVDNLQYVQCGGAFDIPTYLPKITSFVINFLKILTPIILIFTSVISLIKAITSSKEDEMNKAKAILIRRIAIAALIFFTITITEFVIDKVADEDEHGNISSCLECFVNNTCSDTYYKNYVDGAYECFYVNDKSADFKGSCH